MSRLLLTTSNTRVEFHSCSALGCRRGRRLEDGVVAFVGVEGSCWIFWWDILLSLEGWFCLEEVRGRLRYTADSAEDIDISTFGSRTYRLPIVGLRLPRNNQGPIAEHRKEDGVHSAGSI